MSSERIPTPGTRSGSAIRRRWREYLGGLEGEVSLDGSQVTLLRDDLQDDSVEAERFVLELEQNDESWKLVSARWEQRCHAGRGHQLFSPELCI